MIPINPTIPPMVAPTETALSRPLSGSPFTAMAPWVAAPESADEEVVIRRLLVLGPVLIPEVEVDEVTSPAMGAIPTSDVVVIATKDEVMADTAVTLLDKVAERIVEDVVPSADRAEATAYISDCSQRAMKPLTTIQLGSFFDPLFGG
jgi:hypothetical protein